MNPAELDSIVEGTHTEPHAVLGAHAAPDGVEVRVLRPLASAVSVVTADSRHGLEHEHRGIWHCTLPGPEVPDYRLEVEYDGNVTRTDDPYRFLPTLGEVDLHLIGEGRHEQLWRVLGAHVRRYDTTQGEVVGTSFSVWAPNARGVRVAGDFNHWDSTPHPMRSMGSSGVWELFVPDVGLGTRYKFDVLGADGVWREKADPLAFYAEPAPSNASVVFESAYSWGDADWLDRRATRGPQESPLAIYELHLGSWRCGRSYRDLATELVDYIVDMGFTHVELLPVMEHPYGGSWGYQVTSYYAPTSRYGDPDDLRLLIDRLHQAGIGVIVDWVPAHFPKDAWALARFDGTTLYEHGDPSRGEHPDWGTLIFDFGRSEVRNFLVANALYWLEEFHVDGIRVDAVASMLYLDYSREEGEWKPNVYGGRENIEAVDFLQEMNATCYKRFPGIVTVAEESTSWPGVTRPTHLGGLGFGMKWNMGWMHDSLAYMSHDPIHRQFHHQQLTFSMMYAYSENYVLPISHDEVVHGKGTLVRKMPGDRWQQLANLRAYLAFMWGHPGKQLLFMGSELGQEAEWSEERELDWWLVEHVDHRGVQSLVRDLNRAYREHPALWALDQEPAGFSWIDANDAVGNVFSFLRGDASGQQVAVVANFAAVPHEHYRIGLPAAGTWSEIINTDSEAYCGSGVGNLGAVQAEETAWHDRPASATVRLPPLGVIWLRYDG
ncbi:MAG: 1,4-alpha-glucan branching protein GlgB [Propionibacteriales bacterium]|nr:1,4-alpha-glucan branching protein GlgB [Propionibacteriales bacterium]